MKAFWLHGSSGTAMCQHDVVSSWRVVAAIGTAAAATAVLPTVAASTAQAVGCPDAEVIFARGTTEQPGPGPTGTAFIDALRTKVDAKSVGVYAVDYPATLDFATAVDGIADARAHILATAATCPDTKMVLGGFSQGAAVMGFVTTNAVPDGLDPATVPTPLPPDIADHVAAVALFGKPSARFMRAINDPTVTIGPQYVAKTVDLCITDDLVCDPKGRSFGAHNQYFDAGLVDEGATFAAVALETSWAADGPTPPPTAVHLPAPPPPTAVHLTEWPNPGAQLGPPPGPVIAAPGPASAPPAPAAPVV